MKRLIKFFDRLEDKIRQNLSRVPVIYSIVGGIAIVSFWRGVWMVFDTIPIFNGQYGPIINIVFSTVIMLGTGLFVSFFVGDRIILSGLKREKKLEEKALEEIQKDVDITAEIRTKMDRIEKKLEEINSKIK